MLTTKELTEKLNLHENTIYKLISKGLPYIKIGNVFRYDYEKVLQWLENDMKEDK